MLVSNLLKTLEIVSPALGRGDVTPELACMWFNGKTVTTFDDSVAITTDCVLPITGGLKGTLLLSILGKHIGNSEITVSQKDTVLDLALGKRTKAKIPVSNGRSFVMEESNPKAILKFNRGALQTALAHCVKCVGADSTKPEYYGITFETEPFEDSLSIYSGDTRTLVEAVVPIKNKPSFTKVILPIKFCQQVLRYISQKDATLEIVDDYALLKTQYVTIYGRNLPTTTEGDSTPRFFKNALKLAKNFMPMPPINRMLERAAILDEERDNLNLSVVATAENKRRIKFYINKENNAELTDTSGAVPSKHEPIDVLTSVRNIKHGAALQEINVNNKYIIMRTVDDGYWITQLVGIEPNGA